MCPACDQVVVSCANDVNRVLRYDPQSGFPALHSQARRDCRVPPLAANRTDLRAANPGGEDGAKGLRVRR